jgi:uncharacterized protein involved in outer membrane biogenesis
LVSDTRRTLWIGLAAAAVSLAVIVAVVGWALNPASLKPRLVDAVERATGRTLTISGRIGIKLSLLPTISMEDVALSNPPGFSRPDMVKVARVELTLGLEPLLRHVVEIEHIELLRPDILLETDQAGHPNWDFRRRPPAGSVPPGDTVTAQVVGEKFTTSLKDINVVDGQVGWIDPKSGHELAAGIERLKVTAPAGLPTQTSGIITYDGRMVDLTARTGSLEGLRSATAAAPWPVAVKLESGGAVVSAEGRVVQPLAGRGYVLTLDGDVPDPPAFAALLPRLPLESLHNVVAHAEISDSGGPTPTLSALDLRLGSADLNKFMHGARLGDVTLSARDTSPLKVSARLTMPGGESGIGGTVGDLRWLTSGRKGPVAVDLEWNAASARGNIKGTIQEPKRFAGFALDVAVNVPNPAAVMDGAPPALKSVVFQTRLTDASWPVPFRLTSNAGDLEGVLAISRSPRLAVTGTVSSRQLDVDMLRVPAAVEVPMANGSAPGTPAPARESLIPDTKLPLERINAADADIKFSLADVRFGGTDIRGINASLLVKDGVLRLDPITVSGPDQRLSAALVVDAAETPPQVHITAETPGVPLRPLLAALGLPAVATGAVEIHADLTGTGDTPRALAASLDGWAGVAVEGGQLDSGLVNSWLEQLRPLHIDGANVTDLRCFAMRADAKSGTVDIEPMALNTAALIVEGSGDVDLANETLALRLRPRTKIGGTGIALPVRVTGPMRAPSTKIDISSKGFGGGALAGLILGGKDVMGAAGGGDPCPAALARARQGAPASAVPGGEGSK